MTVSNVPTSVEGNETDGFPASPEERRIADGLRRILDQSFHESSDKVDIKVLHGDPAQRIVEYAEYTDSDLIVIGSRGQGSLKRAVLGSVSESVVNKSRKPVLIVR